MSTRPRRIRSLSDKDDGVVFECVQAARNVGCEWAVYEHDHLDSTADLLELGGRTLVDMVQRSSN